MNHTKPDEKAEEAHIERVLQVAGRRLQPSDELAHSVRAAAHAEWSQMVRLRRRQRRRMFALAAAASIALVAVAGLVGRSVMMPAPIAVASIARVTGDVRIDQGWGRSRLASAAQPLRAGEKLMAGANGRAALALSSGVSVRIDHDTQIEFADAHRAALSAGAAYVDSPGESVAERRLRIETPIGAVQHFGTQYEVKLMSPSLRLRIREGKVAFTPNEGLLQSGSAGEQLTVAADGQVDRMPIDTHGVDWEWASELALTMDIDGRPLKDFLAWAARELGQPLVYATPQSEAAASQVVLRGSVSGLAPEEALKAVLSTTHLRDLEDGIRIVIALEPANAS